MRPDNTSLRIGLLGATFSTQNMGVGALAAGAITCIKHQFSDARICFVDYGETRQTYGFRCNGSVVPIPLVNIRFSKKIYLPNNIVFLIVLALALRLIPS